MKLYVNRRIRDKAMVLGLPAESFLACLGLACSPVLIVVFLPVFIVVWIPWACGVYWLFRNLDRLKRNLHYRKQYPLHLKNR